VEFQQNDKDKRTIEFYKDQEDSAVIDQNGLVCIKTIFYFFYLFSPVHWAMARVQYVAGRDYPTKEVPCHQCF
jgi:hypothetical protein